MKDVDGDDLERRYLSGETPGHIAKSLGISVNTVKRRLEGRGVTTRTVSECQRIRYGTPNISDQQIADRYRSGMSEWAIHIETGISRTMIRPALIRQGVEIRGRSEAGFNRASKMTEQERLDLTQAAHAAVRGVPKGEETLIKFAATREFRMTGAIGATEFELADMLADRGILAIRQKAIGRYNIDLALAGSSIAVEVFGGHWHSAGYHATGYRKRLDYLLDRGWMPIIVWATATYPMSVAAADYIVARHQVRRLQEPERGCEHVIRGDGRGGPAPESQPKCPTGVSGDVR